MHIWLNVRAVCRINPTDLVHSTRIAAADSLGTAGSSFAGINHSKPEDVVPVQFLVVMLVALIPLPASLI